MAESRKVIAHGTRNTYDRHGCRCDLCRAVNARRTAARRAAKPDEHSEAMRKSYARDPEKFKQIRRDERASDPRKNKARCAVTYAIEKGRMVRGECERQDEGDCRGRIEAHHDDYDRPLAVRWLCTSHHRRLHIGRLTPDGRVLGT